MARFEPDAPAEVQRILTKTLRKDRSQRYQTVQDLLLDLQALREDLQSHARPEAHLSRPFTPSPRPAVQSDPSCRLARKRRVWLVLAAVVLVLGAVAGRVDVENGAARSDASHADERSRPAQPDAIDVRSGTSNRRDVFT